MNEQPESPFFPVPVRWFEIPMNTGRWDFARSSDLTSGQNGQAPAVPTQGSVPASSKAGSAEAEDTSRVGRILNVRV